MQKLLLFLFMSWGISLYGQQLKVELSLPGNIKDDVTDFHRYGNRLYSNTTNWGKMQVAFTANLKKVKYGIELTQYDEQLKELKKLSLDNGEKDFGPFSPTVQYSVNAIYVLYFKFVDEDKVKMYVAKVNPDDLSVVVTKEVMEYDQKNQAFWGAVKTIEDTQTFYTTSENGKNVWIIHASPGLLQSCVIDGDLNIVQKIQSVPIKLQNLLVTATYIGNDGNKVLVYRHDNPQLPRFYSSGIFFQSANTKGSFVAIKFPKGFVPGNLELQQSKDGKKLYLGGQYFGDDYELGGKGVLLGDVNTTTQSISTPKFYPYSDELKQRVLILDFASRKKGEIVIADYNLRYSIAEMNNGTVVLSGAVHTSSNTTGYISNYMTIHAYNYTGPIIHAFIKPDGNVAMTLIPKEQANTSFTSFLNYVHEDKLVCIYADLPKYQEKEFNDKDIKLVRLETSLVPVANVYDSDGKLLSRKMLIDSEKKMKGNIMIGHSSKIEGNKFLLPVGELKTNMVKYFTRVNQICYLEIL